MKNKSDLKRKVLCSLLAASTMGIFYSSDALAASVDNILVKGDEMTADVVNPSEGKGGYIYGITGGNVYVDSTTTEYDDFDGTTEIVAGGLKGTVANVNGIVSKVGAMVGLDQSIIDAVGSIDAVLQKTESANALIDTTINKDTGLYLKNYGYDWVRYYGAIGGDVSINTGLQGSAQIIIGDADGTELLKESEATSIVRNGNINNTINSGSVIGGVGGSAAVALGKMEASAEYIKENAIFGQDVTVQADIKLNGKTTTTINGNVNTTVAPNANVIGWTNGGTAIGLGGTAESTINGNTVLTIDGTDRADHAGNYETPGANDILPQLTTALNIMKGSKINAIGVTGGGMAVTTIGGTADSNVSGTTTININNATVLGAIGGGIAGAVDATGVANELLDKTVGNDNGTSGFGIKTDGGFEIVTGPNEANAPIKVEVSQANEGGSATATTGDTNINLTGNSTAVGVIGGGVAAASHTYTWKGDGTNTEEQGYTEDDEYGRSEANATTGKSHITIALDNTGLDGAAKRAMLSDVSSFKNKLTGDTGDLQADELKDLANKGAAIGVFGGGAAIAHSGNGQFVDEENKDQALSEKDGAFATATTDGSQIDIYSGYVVGVMGGGIAGTDNNATAKSEMTDTVDININGIVAEEGEKSTEVVGVFGNGFAYFTGSSPEGKNNLKGQAVVTAEDTNINVYGGKVDGIVNGGLAIDDSQSNTTNAIVTTTTGTINIGSNAEINVIQFESFDSIVGNVPTDKIDMASYVAGVKDAAENVAIAAGGVAVGGGAESTVKNAEVNVYGTVNGDIIGGGVGAYGYTESDDNTETEDVNEAGIGAHVNNSTINLYTGANIDGNVYAGGSVSDMTDGGSGYDQAKATVGNATINLAGATVTGVLSGKGVSGTDSDEAETSTLNLIGENTLTFAKDKDGTVLSDPTKVKDFTNFNATAGSVTKVEGLDNATALIDATGTEVKVDGSAKLDINDFKAGNSETGNEYKVISNTDAEDDVWTNDNLVYDRTEAYAQNAEKDGEYTINYKTLNQLTEDEKADAVNDFVDSLGEGGDNFEGTANGIIRNGENTNAGAKDFFGDYTKGEGTSRDLAAMAMIGEAAGVTSNTIDVAGDMADNSVLRLSFTQDDITGEPKVNEDGAIWAKYIHNKHDLDGMDSSFGDINSSSDFDGATIGVDFAKKGKVQSGIAFSYGSGDSHGMGINNDFDMWGLTLYGNVKNDDTNVIADIGFSESDNELTGTAMGKDIKADRDVSVFTVGVRAEKMYTNGSTQIVPYTGLRYYNVDPDSYTAYYDGQKFGEYDADRQNIWTLPVGVSLRNETVTESGWRLTPKVDVAYIWAFGDTDNSFDLNTGSGVDTLDYTVMDSGSWLGSVGFEAGKDDWAFGVGYSYQKGSHEEANKWFVNVEYSF